MTDIEFLSRIYNLSKLPSTDSRYSTAEQDILMHRVHFSNDWEDDWIYTDDRFDLIKGSSKVFLKFLCETVHPIVRPDAEEAEEIVKVYNDFMSIDGWQLEQTTMISGHPVYGARSMSRIPSVKQIKVEGTLGLDAKYIKTQITRMEKAVDTDTELAIGTAKEFIETICKTILVEMGDEVNDKDEVIELVKKVRGHLELLPSDVRKSSRGGPVLKRVLSNVGTIAQGLAELRGLYGTGHGKTANAIVLESRHARLAVNAANTLGTFLFETFQKMKRDAT